MLNIGIIGAENSHCAAIAKLCNVDKKVPGVRVTSVWGEKKKFAQAAAEAGQIPTIVSDWREMAGQVDGVMIDHRHPGPHAEVAKFFIKQGIPTFVDKPFTFTLREAKALCKLADKNNVPLTTFSVIPQEKNYAEFCKACKKAGDVSRLVTFGPAELKSKYGGVFFYGIHQVDAVIELLGTDVKEVNLIPDRQGGGVGTMVYANGTIVTLNFIPAYPHFHWTAAAGTDLIEWEHVRDEVAYVGGAKLFAKMFKTGKRPFDNARMLAPVAVLEAMQKSLDTGKPVRVPKVG